jgi:hypothetical protein
MRRAEDRIRKFSDDLVSANKEAEQRKVLANLRITLHEYIESLRTHLAAYPYVVERRNHGGEDRRRAPR